MAEALIVIAMIVFFLVLFTLDDIKEMVNRRCDSKVKIAEQETAQKRLDLEIAKEQSSNSRTSSEK